VYRLAWHPVMYCEFTRRLGAVIFTIVYLRERQGLFTTRGLNRTELNSEHMLYSEGAFKNYVTFWG